MNYQLIIKELISTFVLMRKKLIPIMRQSSILGLPLCFQPCHVNLNLKSWLPDIGIYG